VHVRGSVPNDTSLVKAEQQVFEAFQGVVKAVADGALI
jgi:hypothetical protein